MFSCLASAEWWVPTARSIPAVVKAKSDLASWVHNLSGYSIMSLYHKLAGAAGEKTSAKEWREATLKKHDTDPLASQCSDYVRFQFEQSIIL